MTVKHLFAASLLVTLLVPALVAQKLAVAVNDNLPLSSITGASSWFCIQVQAPPGQPLPILGVQFHFLPRQPTQNFAIYDQDPGTSKPNAQLALGSFNTVPLPAWQGGLFQQPVLIMPGQVFFVGFDNSSGSVLPIVQNGVREIHYWSPPAWNGPFSTQNWAFRLYLPGGAGTMNAYGTGSSGSAGQASLSGLGWPNTGNPIGLAAQGVPAGAGGVLLLGRYLPGFPIGLVGTVYAFPILSATPALADSSGPFFHQELRIPGDPFLAGARLAGQVWFLDPRGPGGLVHSNGLDIVLGN